MKYKAIIPFSINLTGILYQTITNHPLKHNLYYVHQIQQYLH